MDSTTLPTIVIDDWREAPGFCHAAVRRSLALGGEPVDVVAGGGIAHRVAANWLLGWLYTKGASQRGRRHWIEFRGASGWIVLLRRDIEPLTPQPTDAP